MKTKNFLSASLIFVTILLYACKKDENNSLTAQDQLLLTEMQDSYENARLYNDTLNTIDEHIAPDDFEYCDSAFHHYVEQYDSLHRQYPHLNGEADHFHDSQGMHMMETMMNMTSHNPWTDGHHRVEHDMMDELESEHTNMFHQP